MKRLRAVILLIIWFGVATTQAADIPYSPAAANSHPDQVFWGDTHVHTALSGDGFAAGGRLNLDSAYRFAKGEEVTSNSGQPVKLRRPLDFIVLADHGNNVGAAWARHNYNEDADFRNSRIGQLWKEAQSVLERDKTTDPEALTKGSLLPAHRINQISVRHRPFRESIWQRVIHAADRHNDPGNFTAFIGYEWTPSGTALHRVIVFKDDAKRAEKVLPFTSYDSRDPEALWQFLDRYQAQTGGSALAIPHNSNLTSGLMFALKDFKGEPLDADYGRRRAQWEPLVEATQIKGDSETHPYLSPDDEFADYETWNGWAGKQSTRRPLEATPYEYVRSALKLGLNLEANLGTNPFKFGLIGSSDAHTGLAAVAEDNFWGKMGTSEPQANRMFEDRPSRNWEANAAGYAAVWATDNTRTAIFDAMQRKEVYASTGPRIKLRFFGGWEYEPEDVWSRDFASIGYEGGVPMGGDLTSGPPKQAPRFLIRAVKDPDGANLDRIQIIKGWRDGAGQLHEKVYHAALSDDRIVDSKGKAPVVGSTVNVGNASYTNTIGDPELAVVWQDPDFTPTEPAFYYVRVIEIPTPRWTAYDAKYFGLKVPDTIPMVTQERAYSSPIWYTPE